MYEPASKLSRLERSGKCCDQCPIKGLSSDVSAGLVLFVLSVHSVISDKQLSAQDLPIVLAYGMFVMPYFARKMSHATLGRTASWNA